MKDQKIDGYDNLVKRKGAVVSNDTTAYKQALKRRQKEVEEEKLKQELLNNINKTNELEKHVKNIESKLDVLIDLLRTKNNE